MITQEQIVLVRKTWRMLRTIDPAIIGGTFYTKLFTSHPRLKRLFPKDMEAQYVKLTDMLNMMVAKLDRLPSITVEIEAMAQRHVHYGVKPEHYKMVGESLLWTLEKGLGTDWTPEVKDAWTALYHMIAQCMMEAAS